MAECSHEPADNAATWNGFLVRVGVPVLGAIAVKLAVDSAHLLAAAVLSILGDREWSSDLWATLLLPILGAVSSVLTALAAVFVGAGARHLSQRPERAVGVLRIAAILVILDTVVCGLPSVLFQEWSLQQMLRKQGPGAFEAAYPGLWMNGFRVIGMLADGAVAVTFLVAVARWRRMRMPVPVVDRIG